MDTLTTDLGRRLINLGLSLACLAAGGGSYIWLVATKPMPHQRATAERIPEIATKVVEPRTERTPVLGHGTVRAKNQVNVVPEVSGRLTHTNPNLAVGKILRKGELLFKIDPTIYDARVRQAESEIRRLEIVLDRTDAETASLEERIINAEQMLAIEEQDYLTSQRLFQDEHVGTRREVDVVHQKYLRQKDAVVELRSRRLIMPHVRVETEAQLDAARARLAQARYDLENTEIKCPFNARVETVGAYKSQVVTAFFSIATLTDMEAFEVSVGVDPRELRWLDEAIRPSALGGPETTDGPAVEVKWSLHGQESVWKGRVTRFERVDEATRTARMVVEVRQEDMVAAVRGSSDGVSMPTLAIGMYCATSLPVQPLFEAIHVPRAAIHDGHWVYVFEPEDEAADPTVGRLVRREVPILRTLGDDVLVDYRGRSGDEPCELAAGERIVVSTLSEPVAGMKVRLRTEEIASGDLRSVDPPTRGSRPLDMIRPDALALVAAVRAQRGEP